MKAFSRSLASGCGLLAIGFVAGISVGTARSDHRPGGEQLAQAASLPGNAAGIDMDAVEKAVNRAAKAAFDKAAEEAVDRIQKTAVPPELATLRQRVAELDRLRSEIASQVSAARATALHYTLWGLAAFFGVMVLASVVGGSIVAALFRPRRRA
jgi:pyruvate/2-oxoglutarate dehydrogenase complex dihydrolipoamide acyltransferase (E2) component